MMFGFIGAGNMAYAMMKGILSAGHCPDCLIAFDPSPERKRVCTELGAVVADSIAEVCDRSDVIFLAVKPQSINQVLPEMRGLVRPSQIVVSIIAGISADFIKRRLGFDAKVIVGMPNTPMLLGVGAMTLAHIPPVTEDEFEMVAGLLRAVSVVEKVTAKQIVSSIPIQGSMPALIYEIGRILTDYASQYGFADDVTLRLFSQTLIGSANMMTQTGYTPSELVKMVCSPGGTTIAGLTSLENDGFEASLRRCFDAFIRRAHEMNQEFEQ